ncbi:MAG: hypothetical protein V1918_10805, partial [Planctomycetota bacterium]
LFYQGKIAFLTGHSADSYTLVSNADFPVAIIPIPPVGDKHKYSQYYTGPVTESGNKVEGMFGIPKATKHFDLALQLLQFMTSYDVNQETMDACKWPPAVKQAKYSGFMKAFEPYLGGNPAIWDPFRFDWRGRSHRKRDEVLEEIIRQNIQNPKDYFLLKLRENKHYIIDEMDENLTSYQRANLMREMRRSQLTVGLWQTNLVPLDRERIVLRGHLVREDFTERVAWNYMFALYRRELEDF